MPSLAYNDPGDRSGRFSRGADVVQACVSTTTDQTEQAAHAGWEWYRARRTFDCDRLAANASRRVALMRPGMPPDHVVVDVVVLHDVVRERVSCRGGDGTCPVPGRYAAIESRWRTVSTKQGRTPWKAVVVGATDDPMTLPVVNAALSNVVRGRPTWHSFGIGGRRRLNDSAWRAWPAPTSPPTNCSGQ